jgi:membrane fusion protein (multidrug efflux system)
VPADLNQTFSSVRQALADLLQSAAQLGICATLLTISPQSKTLEEFYKRDPGGGINRIWAEVIKNAPGLKQAEAA